MKGIILSGGTGSRLYPLTKVVNKQLLPVYDKPMVYYPLSTLIQSGIRELCVISSPDHIELYRKLFSDHKLLGLDIQFKVQSYPRGIAEAFTIAADFIRSDSVCLILGDNIFHGTFTRPLSNDGGLIYGYWVKDPRSYGVVEIDGMKRPISIEEKPRKPKSNYAIPGLYFFDKHVVDFARIARPSARGEVEITEVIKSYMSEGRLRVEVMPRGVAWLDAGTTQTLAQSSAYVQTIQDRQGKMIACIEEDCYNQGFITKKQFKKLITQTPVSEYRTYLENVSL